MTTKSGTMLADRSVLRVAGEDVRGFLQGLLTNDVAALAPDRPQWTALLTPQGKILFDMMLWADGDDVLIDVEASQAEALARRLAMYRLRRAITIDRTDLAVHWSRGEVAGVPDPRLADLGRRWLGAIGDAAPEWLAHRLSLGVTEGGAELGAGDTLWLEANARELNGVSFTKGCYVGQENTARMHHRGKVTRRLVVMPSSNADVGGARAVYPDLALMVERRRMDELDPARLPRWLADGVAADQRPTAE